MGWVCYLGSHFLNSFTQLGTVARGAAMMKGPERRVGGLVS